MVVPIPGVARKACWLYLRCMVAYNLCMADSALFLRDERRVAAALGQLGFANPFGPKRFALESSVFGQDARAVGPLGGREARQALRDRVRPLIYSARERLSGAEVYSREDLELYEGLVLCQLFFRYAEQFEEVVHSVIDGEVSSDLTFGLYEAFEADAAFFLRLEGLRTELEVELPHLFALFFQLIRAFIWIDRTIVGSSEVTQRYRERIWESIFTHDMRRYRRTLFDRMAEIPTLITGPSGSGKELVARAIGLSRYIPFDPKRRRFVRAFDEGFQSVNLSALSETLLESELFGHQRGSFTGATADHRGFFELAGHLGSVFLDEIGEVNEAIQVKLLRVLQNRTFQRLGSSNTIRFDGKFIAATNRDLVSEMEEGRFREDFYYRLCADQIWTPSLSQQIATGDNTLVELVSFIARRLVGREDEEQLRDETLSWIQNELGCHYTWPGNVRELEQCVRNILIRREYVPARRRSLSSKSALDGALASGHLSAEALLNRYITHIYFREGSYEGAGRVLEMDRRTVKSKIDSTLLRELEASKAQS